MHTVKYKSICERASSAVSVQVTSRYITVVTSRYRALETSRHSHRHAACLRGVLWTGHDQLADGLVLVIVCGIHIAPFPVIVHGGAQVLGLVFIWLIAAPVGVARRAVIGPVERVVRLRREVLIADVVENGARAVVLHQTPDERVLLAGEDRGEMGAHLIGVAVFLAVQPQAFLSDSQIPGAVELAPACGLKAALDGVSAVGSADSAGSRLAWRTEQRRQQQQQQR